MNENPELENELRALPTGDLERRLSKLPRNLSNRKRKRKSKRAQKTIEEAERAQQERELINTILSERLETEQAQVRAEVEHTLMSEGVSALRIGDLHTWRQREGDLAEHLQEDMTSVGIRMRAVCDRSDRSRLTFEETKQLHEELGAGVLEPHRSTFEEYDMNFMQNEGNPNAGYPWIDEDDASGSVIVDNYRILALEKDAEGAPEYLGHSLIELDKDLVTTRRVPVSRTWAAIAHVRTKEYLSTLEKEKHGNDTERPHLSGLNQIQYDFDGANAQSVTVAVTAANILSKPEKRYVQVAADVSASASRHVSSKREFIDMAINDRDNFVSMIETLDDSLTTRGLQGREFTEVPRSIEEVMFRLEVHAYTLVCGPLSSDAKEYDAQSGILSQREKAELAPVAQYMMDRIPEMIPFDNSELKELMNIVCPELHADREVYEKLLLVKAGGRVFVVHTEAPDDPEGVFYEKYENTIRNTHEVIPDDVEIICPDNRIVEQLVRDFRLPDGFRTMDILPLCTLQELEDHYFRSQDINGRFLMDPNEDGESVDEIDSLSTARESHDDEPVQVRERLRTVKILLLRLGLNATFSRDDAEKRGKDQSSNYSSVDAGHYVIITIPELGMQFAVSDDYGKAMYAVYNQLDVERYTDMSPQQLRDDFGGTPSVRWTDREQWMHSVGNTLEQQKADPKRVFPVNTSYPTPLDNFPNEESIDLLRKENQFVADASGKGDTPWMTRVTDYTRDELKSGEHLWSFGGEGGGGTYLDRLSREFELKETETGVRQDLFRRMMLKLVLYECYPEYRALQEQRDQKLVQASSDTSQTEKLSVEPFPV